MPKLKLLILDAGVVIKLHEVELWQSILEKCDVYLSSIVARRESKYHDVAGDDWGQDIDLSACIESQQITLFECPKEDVAAFKSQFDAGYFADLDDGEAESLAYLAKQRNTWLISSGDAIVYKVLGNMNLGESGISLEEILQKCGLGRKVEGYQYSKAFRLQMTARGAKDMVLGRGLKRN